jgi:hypothetical protein
LVKILKMVNNVPFVPCLFLSSYSRIRKYFLKLQGALCLYDVALQKEDTTPKMAGMRDRILLMVRLWSHHSLTNLFKLICLQVSVTHS